MSRLIREQNASRAIQFNGWRPDHPMSSDGVNRRTLWFVRRSANRRGRNKQILVADGLVVKGRVVNSWKQDIPQAGIVRMASSSRR